MAAVLIYITTSSAEEAKSIGKTLVGERLAACANILPAITSCFWWDGEVQEDSENVLIVKSRDDLVERITDRVKDLHGYDCPCVVALPISGGNPEFLAWIASETGAGTAA